MFQNNMIETKLIKYTKKLQKNLMKIRSHINSVLKIKIFLVPVK